MREFKRLWRGDTEDKVYFQKFDKKLRGIIDERSTSSMFPDDKTMESVIA